MRPLSVSGEFSRVFFAAFFGLNEFYNNLEGEVALEVVIGGLFLHDVFGYGGVFQSLYQGVHDNLVCVGGFTKW